VSFPLFVYLCATDTSFLSGLGVMDYSLLVGVDKRSQELVVGVIDYIRQVGGGVAEWPSSWLGLLLAGWEAGWLWAELWSVKLGLDARMPCLDFACTEWSANQRLTAVGGYWPAAILAGRVMLSIKEQAGACLSQLVLPLVACSTPGTSKWRRG
jgi:hypothetical protein